MKDTEDDLPEEKWNDDEPYDEDGFFEPCADCIQPDACADFSCAIKAGLQKPKDW